MRLRLCLISSLFFFASSFLWSQNLSTQWKGGIVLDIGSPVMRWGATINFGVLYKDELQGNIEWKVYDQLKSFGPKDPGLESKISIGMFYGFGEGALDPNPFYSLYQNQLNRKYALSYLFHYYWDKTNTSQGSGSILIQLKQFQIITENDILGNLSGLDQYRTGAFAVSYRKDQQLIHLKSILYTGATRCAQVNRVTDDGYPSRFGYKDNSHCQHADCSHGVLALSYSYAGDYRQIYQLGLGVDADQIRNAVQNKLIHDMYFIPSFMNSAENPHIPMIDRHGKLFLFKEDQQVRLPRFFYSLSANGNLFY